MNFSSCHSRKHFFTVNSRLSVGALSELQIRCAMFKKNQNSFRAIIKYNAQCFFLFIYNLILHLKLVFSKVKVLKHYIPGALFMHTLYYLFFFSFFALITPDTES